jgi:hypothetical protein
MVSGDLAGSIGRDYIRPPEQILGLAMTSDEMGAWRGFWLALPIAAAASVTPTHAALRISSAPTFRVSCSAGVCTTTGANANLNVSDLTGMLATADVTVTTDAGSQDINVRAPVTWASMHTLTLDAYGSTTVGSPIVVEGFAGLTLTTGDGNPAGRLALNANVTFWDLTSSLIVNGNSYTLVGDIATLASDIAAAPSGRYALAKNYDTTADGTYTSAPIQTNFSGAFEGLGNTISHFALADTSTSQFTGFFARLASGAKISDLKLFNATVGTTRQHDGVGLLTGLNDGGAIAGVQVQGRMTCRAAGNSSIGGIAGINIGGASIDRSTANVIIKIEAARSAFVGGLAGSNATAAISNSSSTGRVGQTGTHLSSVVGGLVGDNSFLATVSSSHSSAVVSNAQYAGGLAGTNVGAISDSFATGNVSNAVFTAGGLVGQNGGAITNSYAGGSVSGNAATGGLVGNNFGGTITAANATGNVTGTSDVGGLVGTDSSFNNAGGTIAKSYATGTVTGVDGSAVGGVVGIVSAGALGQPGGSVSQSFATGAASGGNGASVGGVAGTVIVGSVTDTYAMGSVTGGTGAHVGGLVGKNGLDASNQGTIGTSYSTGAVSAGAGSSIGGLLGFQAAGAGSVSSSYWDTDTSGITNPSQGAGNVSSDAGITAQTSAQLKSGIASGFSPSIWNQTSGINGDFPFLIAVPPH